MTTDSIDPFAVSPTPLTPNDEGMTVYGCEVSPKGPRSEMFAIDTLAGGPPADRSAAAAVFTGGDGETGAGGRAIGQEPGMPVPAAGVTVQRGHRTGL